MSYVPFPLHEIANYKIQEPNKSEIPILKSEKNIQRLTLRLSYAVDSLEISLAGMFNCLNSPFLQIC